MKCGLCGKEFEAGNRPDGIPNGMGFQLEDGEILNVCADCIMAPDIQKKLEKWKKRHDKLSKFRS